MEVVDSLKKHLRNKYPSYSETEIEELIYKFLNEYLMAQMSQDDDFIPDSDDPST